MTAPEPISRKQEAAIVCLLTCPSITEAALQCGVAEVTLHRWLKQEGFQTAYRAARHAAFQQDLIAVQQTSHQALETFREVMGDANAPASARVAAARTIMDIALKAVTLEDIDVRLTALEQAQKVPGGDQ